MNSIQAFEYIRLGELLWFLYSPVSGITVDQLDARIDQLLSQLEKCGLSTTKAAADWLKEFRKKLTVYPQTGSLSSDSISALSHLMDPVHAACKYEAEAQKLIVVKEHDVSRQLLELPKAVANLTDTQKQLHQETIRCMECEAYRSAMVMGWNLTFDFIREWVFNNHLAKFNNTLSSKYHKTSIVTHEDFFLKDAPGERMFLDVCKDEGLFGGEVYDHLCQYLRYRNNYAHPGFRMATASKANAYIEHLIDIMTSRPFI